MRTFQRVAVLMGGPSAEREVSLKSGAAVASGLRASGYDVVEVDVTDETLALPEGVQAVFVALHGTFGEDGGVQALLEARGIPFTGSGAASSRLSFDKLESKRVFERAGIPTPPYAVLARGDACPLDYPVVIKPLRQGSSIGVHRVNDDAGWAPAADDALRYGDTFLVESYIPGRELTVGVLEGELLPLVEIAAPDAWYDYRSKYTSGVSRYLVPAPVNERVAARCREGARLAFEALQCRGFARVDFRANDAGDVYILELNSIPGFTETSLLPKAAAQAGIPFAELCDRIMRGAAAGADRTIRGLGQDVVQR